jgi:hypothetical protein
VGFLFLSQPAQREVRTPVGNANGDKTVQPTNEKATSSERTKGGDGSRANTLGLGNESAEEFETALLPHEKELLRELIQSLRGMRYGSLVLAVHEGRVVEIEKTVKIRRNRSPQ